MSIGKFFKTFGHIVSWPVTIVLKVVNSQKSKEIMAEINLYVPQVMIVSALFATATKTERDDHAIEAANEIFTKYSIEVDTFLDLSPDDKNKAIRAAVEKAVQHELPNVNASILFSAVQLAYTLWSGNGKPPVTPDSN